MNCKENKQVLGKIEIGLTINSLKFSLLDPVLRFSFFVLSILLNYIYSQEETVWGRPGYGNLNDPLHILTEAKLPGHVVDKRLRQAQEVIEGWLKPMV